MSAIPNSSADFQDPAFWKKFYKNSDSVFEWYGDFKTFGRVLTKYIKSTDKILQIGCGNSELASQLYDNGYRLVDSIDTDEGVIQKQLAKNSSSRPELQFVCCSAAKIDAPNEKYNVVLDKATLDALIPSTCQDKLEDVEKMFSEICRVLTIAGRYIVFTLAHKYVLNSYMPFFLKRKNFIIRVERNIDSNWKFPLPVFLLIATKLRIPLPSPYMELIISTEKKAIKFSCLENLISAINAEQEFSQFRHLCCNKLEDEVTLILHDNDEKPRYHIAVLDDTEADVLNSYAVFIVPVGRDHDWFFATERGRASLRKQCCKDRLAIVTLYREQKYENMEQVKDELGPYRKSVVEFLSLGKIDVKETRATGHSDINGPWAVEDVRIQAAMYRRLVFLSTQNLVQTEAKLIRNKKGCEIVDLHALTSEYHEAMLAALPLMLCPGEKLSQSTESRLLVLGLGGGVLPSFLHLKFPSMFIVAVELDPKIAEIAKDWFSFNSNPRLVVVIKDALTYIEELVQKKDESLLFDVIFIDVAGSMQEDGLSCPLPSLVTEKALENMYAALRERGVLALNLVTRNEDIAEQIKSRILSIFSHYYSHCSKEDINQVLICPKMRKGLYESRKACENYKKEKGTMRNLLSNLSTLKFYSKRGN
ncbi:Methyltransferase domain family protein [Acanthocheilonema viteae]